MKHLQKFISLIIIIGGVFVVSKTTFASFYPVQGITYSVATTIVPTDSSITLSSFTDANKVTYTMTSFGAIGYGTLDPEYNAKIEDISFTGITANGNGTVTLTGVSRGLSFQTPYGASLLNSRTHLVGSHFILSNTGAFYGQQFAFLNNASTIKGLWTYITSPVVPDPTTALQVVNKEYADALTISGTPKADTSTGGRVQVATGLQMASSTALGTATGNPYLAITTNNATSTYGNGSTSGLKAVITQNDGRIDSAFLKILPTTNGSLSQTLLSNGDGTTSWGNTTFYGSATTTGQKSATSTLDTIFTPGFKAKTIVLYYRLHGFSPTSSPRWTIGNTTFASSTPVASMDFVRNGAAGNITDVTSMVEIPSSLTVGTNTGASGCSSFTLSIISISNTQFTIRTQTTSGDMTYTEGYWYPIAYAN